MGKEVVIIPLTAGDKEYIIRLRKDGCSVKVICDYIGCCRGTVYRYLKKAGMTARKTWSEEDNDKAVQMYNAGATSSEIAKSLGRKKQNVWQHMMYLRKLGYYIKYRRE